MKNKLSAFKEKYFPHIPIILIILLISAIFALISFSFWNFFDDNGILINVATELIGILVTIVFVEYFIRRYEKKRWSKLEQFFQKNLKVFIASIYLEFMTRFKLPLKYEHNQSNISKLLEYKSTILENIKSNGPAFFSSIFDNHSENLSELIELAKINPNPSLIATLLDLKSNFSMLKNIGRQQGNHLLDEYKNLVEEMVDRSLNESFDELRKLESYFLSN